MIKNKPTTEAWEKLKAKRLVERVAVDVENKKIIRQIDDQVNAARLKFKHQPYGQGSAQLMSDQGDLFKHQTFGAGPDKHPRFSRGLVRKNIGGVWFMLPAKKGSGSRGSPGWKK